MIRLTVALALVAILGLTACSGPDPSAPDSGFPSGSIDKLRKGGEPIGHYIHANKEALGRQTFQVAYKLEKAVWRFAEDNDGVVPTLFGDRNLAGKTLHDYFPGKKQLLNPFTGLPSNPGHGFAANEGEVSYLEFYDRQGYLMGFRITAQGSHRHDQYLQFDRYMAESDHPGYPDGSNRRER